MSMTPGGKRGSWYESSLSVDSCVHFSLSGVKEKGRSGVSVRGSGVAFSGGGTICHHDGSPGAFVTAAAAVLSLLLQSALLFALHCIRLWEGERSGASYLFRGFVVVSVVSPMFHGPSRSRKPLARSAVERARGTTSGSPRRVS